MPDQGPERRSTPFAVVNDRYVLEEIVGSGGMGVVYRAQDRVLGRTVAVKMIRQELAGEEFVKRFEREAAILARLRSPSVVVVYDYGQHDNQFFMVTDFLAEGDLAGWLENNGPMPPDVAVPLVAKLAEGLADAHELGILHRDIKPANILLWTRGGKLQPVLADFGIAVTSDLTLTKTGAVVGSPLYMAPERHLGHPASVASDIYSMGCLLYALLSGQPPYWGTEFQAANAHLNSPIPTLPAELPFAGEIDEVIAAAMAKRPEDRPASADDLADRLTSLAQRMKAPAVAVRSQPLGAAKPRSTGVTTVLSPTDPPPSPTPPAPLPAPSAPRRGRRLVVLALVVLLSVLGVGAWWAATDAGSDGNEDPESSGASGTEDGDSADPPVPPPPAPEKPTVRAEGRERAIRFTIAIPDGTEEVGYEAEVKRGTWRSTDATFDVETSQGGARDCAEFRLVAVSASDRVPGPSARKCGQAEDPKVTMEYVDVPCYFDPPYESVRCYYYNLKFRGFKSDARLEVRIRADTDREASLDEDNVREIDTKADGTGLLGPVLTDEGGERPAGYYAWVESTSAEVTIDGFERAWNFNLSQVRQAG